MVLARRFIAVASLILTGVLASGGDEKTSPTNYETALNDKLGKGITPERNACALIWKAIGPENGEDEIPSDYFKRLGIAAPAARGNYFIDLYRFFSEHLKLADEEWDAFCEQLYATWAEPWMAKDRPFINVWLIANEKPLAVAVEASKRPEWFNPLIARGKKNERLSLLEADVPAKYGAHSIVSTLCSRAMLRTGAGKYEAAWEDLLAAHRLSRHVSHGGKLTELISGYGLEQSAARAMVVWLGRTDFTAKKLAVCMKELDSAPKRAMPAEHLDLLRLVLHDAVEHLCAGRTDVLHEFPRGRIPLGSDDFAKLKLVGGAQSIRVGDVEFDRLIRAMGIPNRAARLATFRTLEKEYQDRSATASSDAGTAEQRLQQVHVGSVMDALKWDRSHDRTAQMDANVRVAFALAMFQRDTGHFPESLDELVPKYAKSMPADRFSGQPLSYKRVRDGCRAYSIGENGKDEDGRGPLDFPPGDDHGFSLPLPPATKR